MTEDHRLPHRRGDRAREEEAVVPVGQLDVDRDPVFVQAIDAATGDLLLWYRKPAEKWLEALPVGNGKLGGNNNNIQ